MTPPTSLTALVARPHRRVVIDNDWAGDPDGLVALAHHLLAPGNRVDAVTSSFLNPQFDPPSDSAAAGVLLARHLTALLGRQVPVHAGAERPFDAPVGGSPACHAIIDAALRDDPLPLFVVCGGPLTNVAEALSVAPETASRFTLVWIGGSVEEGRFEYNRDTDPAAARFVLGHPNVRLHQFVVEAYRQCAYSLSELDALFSASGDLGAWLADCFTDPPDWVVLEDNWPLGDSPPVLVTALTTESSRATTRELSEGRVHTVYDLVDTRLLFGDMAAKFAAYGRQHPRKD